MNNQLSRAFEGHNVTIITDEHGDPWFKGTEICAVLELKNSTMVMNRIDHSYKDKLSTTDNVGRRLETIIVSEYGLYDIIMQSRKPAAEKFKKWVYDVLKEIRKTGQYIAPLTDDERIAKLANDSLQMLEDKKALQDKIDKQDSLLKTQHSLIKVIQLSMENDKPKVDYADKVQSNGKDILPSDYAKLLGIKPSQLQAKLSDKKLIFKRSDHWVAYQSYIDIGWLKMAERTYESNKGNVHTYLQLMVTGKGRIKIAERLGLVNSEDKQYLIGMAI